MPIVADEIHMTWFEGPPLIQAFLKEDRHLAGFREDDATIAIRSGRWGMLLDPRSVRLERFVLGASENVAAELLNPAHVFNNWSEASLDLVVNVGEESFRPKGGAIVKEHGYSPIHVVESGKWFQHLALYDLELVSESGKVLVAKSWLEIRAWGDRATIEWFVEPADSAVKIDIQMALRSSTYGFDLHGEVEGNRASLGFDCSVPELAELESEGADALKIEAITLDDFTRHDPQVKFNEVSSAWEVIIPRQPWPSDGGLAYNKELLDRISHFDLSFENTSDEARDLRLRIIHDYHPLTGYVPMMLLPEGKPTSLPLQNSKNWHVKPDKRQPYDSSWVHISTRLHMEPGAKFNLEYAVSHALWEGLPASSAAQLSLIGWGFNGFWTQMALGAWGETLCVQAGRTMRRSFITDVRPFMVKGFESGEPYDWTTNVGGGDIAKIIDHEGKLVLWQSAVQEYGRIGPVLSEFRVTERSACERLRLRISTYLPRSRSIARSFFKVELVALEDFEFDDLALFQLGSDYYNSAESKRIAWGDLNGLQGEDAPREARWGQVMDAVELSQQSPWVTLYDTGDGTGREGEAVRGLIVRDFSRHVDGSPINSLWLSAARTKGPLNAELRLSPEQKMLRKGERIEFTAELVVFPLASDDYYGPDESLKSRLATHPDSWELTAYEATHRGVSINGEPQVFPATVSLSAFGASFEVLGLSEMDTIVIKDLPHPETWQLLERFEGQLVPLGTRHPEEAHPQINYDTVSGSWSAVLSLRLGGARGERTFVLSEE